MRKLVCFLTIVFTATFLMILETIPPFETFYDYLKEQDLKFIWSCIKVTIIVAAEKAARMIYDNWEDVSAWLRRVFDKILDKLQ